MSKERRILPRTDMLFYPWARLSETEDAGRVIDLNQLGLSIVGKEAFVMGDQFSLFIEDEVHGDLQGKVLELFVEVMRCKELESGGTEVGFKIVDIKTENGEVLLNKIIRLLGTP